MKCCGNVVAGHRQKVPRLLIVSRCNGARDSKGQRHPGFPCHHPYQEHSLFSHQSVFSLSITSSFSSAATAPVRCMRFQGSHLMLQQLRVFFLFAGCCLSGCPDFLFCRIFCSLCWPHSLPAVCSAPHPAAGFPDRFFCFWRCLLFRRLQTGQFLRRSIFCAACPVLVFRASFLSCPAVQLLKQPAGSGAVILLQHSTTQGAAGPSVRCRCRV